MKVDGILVWVVVRGFGAWFGVYIGEKVYSYVGDDVG